MKKIKLLIPSLIVLILCGCNYHELNEIYLVSALSIDYDNNYKVSLLTISDEEDKSTRLIEGNGKTITETFYNISTDYNKPLYLGHLNLVIIGEEAGKRGIKELLTIINEDNETKKNFYLILSKDTLAKDVLTYLSSENLETKEVAGISKYLNLESIHNPTTYNTYTKQTKENGVTVLTSYTIKDKKLETDKIGVLENNKLKTWVNYTDEALILNNMIKEFALTMNDKTVLIKNIHVKKKLSNHNITYSVTGTINNKSVDLNDIEKEFQKRLEQATSEANIKNIDYLRFKPFLYDYKKDTDIPLKDIKTNIQIELKN